MTPRKEERYVMLAVVTGFGAQIFCLVLSMILYPPDYSGEVPYYAPESNVLIEFALALLIASSTVMGVKLADEKKILPAAGFTMLAISGGVFMASLWETTIMVTHESFEKSYFINTSSFFLLVPAMLLIACYEDFKKWIRILGVVSTVPMVISSFLFLFHYRKFTALDLIGMIGYTLFMFTQLLWAVNVYMNYKRKMRA